jgi:serine/threonine-protein kinase
MAALAWMLYLSVEPYCRRRWPESLIGCTRLLTGRWRDPLVGRDVLVGVVAGTALGTLVPLAWLADGALGVQRSPLGIAGFTLSRLADHLFLVFYLPYPAIATSIALVFWLVLLRTSLRREWLARLALLALLIVTYLAVVGTAGSALPCSVLLAAGTTWLFVRHGALASAVSTWVQLIAFFMPLTLDAEAWYFGRSAALLALLLALAAWGARTSLGAGPLWRGGLLEA